MQGSPRQKWLQQALKEHNMTQCQLAAYMGLSEKQMSRRMCRKEPMTNDEVSFWLSKIEEYCKRRDRE